MSDRSRTRITSVKTQRAIDTITAFANTSDWTRLDEDEQQALHQACRVLTGIRDRCPLVKRS